MKKKFTFKITLFSVCLMLVLSLQGQVVINEFSAANYDGNDFGDDWIELYNLGTTAVDLEGYYLSDRYENPTKWEIPAGAVIQPNSYFVFYATGINGNIGGQYHTNFKITQTRNKEDVVLANPAGDILDFHLIDDPVQAQHSWARTTDGTGDWGVATTQTIGSANQDVGAYYTSKAAIEPAAGVYDAAVEVSLTSDDTNVAMYYTLDGSEPSASSTFYTGPFTINQTTVVKSISISQDSGVPRSFVDYHTFIINEGHTLPIVSIAGHQVVGLLNGSQNPEPIGSFELFDETGERVADGTGDFNKHGNDSWAYDQRGIDFITRDQLGDDYAIKHQIFPEVSDRTKFQRLMLKAAANDNYPFSNGGAHIRDAYVHTLSQKANLNMDERSSIPCILYVNGEYWGVYDLREKVDDHDFTSYYYDHGRYEIDFIKTWGNTWNEYGNGIGTWDQLLQYIQDNDMSVDANYQYVANELDVTSLIDYMVLHSHNVSADWLNWNTGWWRGYNPDGADIAKKWRYILWDEDATFGHYINYTGIPDQSANADPCNPEFITSDPQGHVDNFIKLQDNEEFFNHYISRYAELNTTYLSCEYMLGLLDEMIGQIEPEMPRQIERWGGTMEGWQANVQELRDFIEMRCTVISDGIVDCYEDEGLTGPYLVTVNVEPPGAGLIKANTLEGIYYPWNMEFFGGLPLTLTAIPQGGSTFSHWEVANHTFTPDATSLAIEMSLESGDEITAYFDGYSPCAAPENITVDPGMTTADISWGQNPDALGYIIKYRKQGSDGAWSEEAAAGSGKMLYGLEECVDYDLIVQSVCDVALGLEIESTFTTECFTATEDAEQPLGFASTYPNPFDDLLNVDIFVHRSQDTRLELLSVDGRVVKEQYLGTLPSGVHQLQMEQLGDLTPGFYLVRLIGEGFTTVERVVKY